MTLQSSLPVLPEDVSMLHGYVMGNQTVSMEVTKQIVTVRRISLRALMALSVYQPTSPAIIFMIVTMIAMSLPIVYVILSMSLNVLEEDA